MPESPLNNVEGVGGIAFNPLAYTAGTPFDDTEKATGVGALKGLLTSRSSVSGGSG